MKWYSIKTHVPPACTNVFIRAISCELNFDRHLVGSIDDFSCIENLIDWELANCDLFGCILQDYKVTHFAIIEPVGIESE